MPSRDVPCSPRELFAQLFLEPEDSAHYLQPALDFAQHQLSDVQLSVSATGPLERWIEQAIDEVGRADLDGHAFSWVARVVRELAPLGLNDGGWLCSAARLPNAARDTALAQLALRSGLAPGSHDAYAQRYAGLLRSLGIAPNAIARFEFDESPQCADLSFEHALLGPCLARFPERFAHELAGFDLWMAALGPAPLLWQLHEELTLREASVRYLDRYDRPQLCELAKIGARALAADDAPRVARGFFAAHQSYLRWERGMCRGNVPFTPREFVLEGVRRKARFAAEHHRDVTLKGHNLETLFLEGGASYERILDHMAATASLIKPGAPDQSPFMRQALSLDGPMFDAFTPAEKGDLREWVAALPRGNQPRVLCPEPLVGVYGAPHEPEALRALAEQRFANADDATLAAQLDDPLLPIFAPSWVQARLAQEEAPAFSPEALARLAEARPASRDARWLAGFVDVSRIDFDEYRALLREHLQRADAAHGDDLLPRMMALRTRLFMPELLGLWLGPDRASQAAADAFLARVEAGAPFELEKCWQRLWCAAQRRA